MSRLIYKNQFIAFENYEQLSDFYLESPWLKEVVDFLAVWFSEVKFIEQQTSGSTDIPKTISLAKWILVESAKATIQYLHVCEKPFLLAMPAKFIGGKMMIVRALVKGVDLYLIPPKLQLEIPAELHFGLTALTPLQMQNSLEKIVSRRSNFDIILLGGGAVGVNLKKTLCNLPFRIFETYGMTETASHIAVKSINNSDEYFTLMPGIEISTGAADNLVIKGKRLGPVPIVTNDMVTIQNNSKFKIIGRIDSIINSGGLKINPEEIEHALEGKIELPFFIAGIPNELLGEELLLIVEGEPYQINNKLVYSNLDKAKQPKRVLFTPAFIYTQTNKINRRDTLKSMGLIA